MAIIELTTLLTSTDLNDYTIIDHLGPEARYLVWHEASAQYATLTLLHNSAEPSTTYLDAFQRVMQDAAELSYPPIAPIVDYGVKDGVPFVVTPYYPGGTLHQYIRMAGPLPLTEVIERLTPVAEALDEAHRHNITHYMLTPDAILRTASDECVVSQFGVGQLALETAHYPAAFLPYAAPEIYLRMPCTAAVDVYALGIIVYQMLTSELPFEGFTYAQQMSGHVNHSAPTVRHIRPDLPPELQHVIDRAMDKLPHVRYPTAGALLTALAQAAGLAGEDEPVVRTRISRETIGGRYSYSRDGAKPGQLKSKTLGSHTRLSKLFVDALMVENRDPAKAAEIYREIMQIEPQYSNGAIVERLARLEQELGTQEAPDLLAQAQTALEAQNWTEAEELARRLLSINPVDPAAQRLQRTASSKAAAAEHYHTARLAMQSGERPAAVMLLRELSHHDPRHHDAQGLRLLTKEVADFIQEAYVLRAHEARILAMTFSPDNQYLVTGSTDRRVRVWRWPDLTLAKDSDLHRAWVCGVVFTPDGQQLLSATWDGEIRLWTVPDLDYAGIIAGLVNQVQAMTFATHDPTLMATASAQWLTLWRVPGGQREVTISEDDRVPVTALTFSPAAPRLVYGLTNGDIRVREVEQPGLPVRLSVPVHHAPVYDTAVSPDGWLIASAARDGSVSLVTMADGAIAAQLEGHTDAACGVTFSPDGSLLATCSRDRTVRLWDPASGEHLKTLEGHRREVRSVVFSPDGRTLASADSSGVIRLWQI